MLRRGFEYLSEVKSGWRKFALINFCKNKNYFQDYKKNNRFFFDIQFFHLHSTYPVKDANLYLWLNFFYSL